MQSNSRPLIIGVTGSIGSGKTEVCAVIKKKYPVFYTDKIAHQVLTDRKLIATLSEKWGKSLEKNRKPDRKAIAELVFSDKAKLDFLSSLVHPQVLQIIQNIVNISTDSVIFFEVPLLFEANLDKCFDYIVLITANRRDRNNRLALRDNISKRAILARIANQLDDKLKKQRSDLTITNNETTQELQDKVLTFLKIIPTLQFREIKPFYDV